MVSAMLPEETRVGFIGLGSMGKHMAGHLASKLPDNAQLFVLDVVPELVKELESDHVGKVIACSSSAEVAEKAVSSSMAIRTLSI